MKKKYKTRWRLPEVTDELTTALEKPDVGKLIQTGKKTLDETGERLQGRAVRTIADFKHAMTVRRKET